MSGKESKLSVENSGVTYDHHGYKLDDPSLKGFSRHFNSATIRGRANVAKATIACLVGYFTYKKISNLFATKNEENPLDEVAIKTEKA